MNISAVLSLVAIGAVLGCILGIANKYLVVEEDHRIADVIEMLPGANCGGCGYPGCCLLYTSEKFLIVIQWDGKEFWLKQSLRKSLINYLLKLVL